MRWVPFDLTLTADRVDRFVFTSGSVIVVNIVALSISLKSS